MPTNILQNKSPFEILFKIQPDYKFLKVFGSACWPNLRPYNANKLQPRSVQCLFLGYSLLHKGYKCFHIQTGRVYFSRDVIFQEDIFPCSRDEKSSSVSTSILGPAPFHLSLIQPVISPAAASGHPTAHSRQSPSPNVTPHRQNTSPTVTTIPAAIPAPTSPIAHPIITQAVDQLPAIPAEMPATTPPITHPIVTQAMEQVPAIPAANTAPTPPLAHPIVTQPVDPLATLNTNTSTSVAPHTTSQNISNNTHSMTTRAKHGIVKPKIPIDGTTKYPLPHALLTEANLDLVEPTCYSSAIKHPQWRKAMNCEFDALLHNQTWKLVSPSEAQNIVGCKWVFRIKR
jgi:hypothetical protein